MMLFLMELMNKLELVKLVIFMILSSYIDTNTSTNSNNSKKNLKMKMV